MALSSSVSGDHPNPETYIFPLYGGNVHGIITDGDGDENFTLIKHAFFQIPNDGHVSSVISGIEIKLNNRVINFPIQDGLYKIFLALAYIGYGNDGYFDFTDSQKQLLRIILGSSKVQEILSKDLSDKPEDNKKKIILEALMGKDNPRLKITWTPKQ